MNREQPGRLRIGRKEGEEICRGEHSGDHTGCAGEDPGAPAAWDAEAETMMTDLRGREGLDGWVHRDATRRLKEGTPAGRHSAGGALASEKIGSLRSCSTALCRAALGMSETLFGGKLEPAGRNSAAGEGQAADMFQLGVRRPER